MQVRLPWVTLTGTPERPGRWGKIRCVTALLVHEAVEVLAGSRRAHAMRGAKRYAFEPVEAALAVGAAEAAGAGAAEVGAGAAAAGAGAAANPWTASAIGESEAAAMRSYVAGGGDLEQAAAGHEKWAETGVEGDSGSGDYGGQARNLNGQQFGGANQKGRDRPETPQVGGATRDYTDPGYVL